MTDDGHRQLSGTGKTTEAMCVVSPYATELVAGQALSQGVCTAVVDDVGTGWARARIF